MFGLYLVNHTMRAVRFYAYGGPAQLVLEQIPRPDPLAGEVLIRIHAAGVTPIDWKIRRGLFNDVMPLPLPFAPGSEFAGIVELPGPGVTSFQKGQAFSETGHGRGGVVLQIARSD
jgi:NADPH:quinone reductase-like Zn-dependent oxidoreductase